MMSGMSFYMFPILLAMLFGGENSLLGYLEPAVYWQQRDIAYEVEALATLLAAPEVNEESMERWVAQLGADRFEDREAASRELAKQGEAARTALALAAKSPDPEVRKRAKEILSSLQPVDEQDKQLDQWMAVFSLSRMESPEAKALLTKTAEGPEGDLKDLARRLLESDPIADLAQSDQEALSGFPETTTGFLQFRAEKYESVFVKAIHDSAALQDMLLKMISQTGDIKIQRLTFAVDDETFLGNQKLVRGRVELNYDPEKLKSALQNFRFKVSDHITGLDVLTSGPLTVMLVDEQNILLQIQLRGRGGEKTSPDLAWVKGSGDLPFAEELNTLVDELPEKTMFRAAWLVPEKFAALQDELAGVEKILAHGNRTENKVGAEMDILAKDHATADVIREYSLKELMETKELLARENDLMVQSYRDFFETVSVVGNEKRVKIKAELETDTMRGFLNQMEQAHHHMEMQRQQIRRQRNVF